MTTLEQRIYSRGLENVYASVLLNEEDSLSLIEQLVSITRYLESWGRDPRQLNEELEFIRSMYTVCFPEGSLAVVCESKSLDRLLVCPGSLAGKICETLFQLDEEHILPDLISLEKEEAGVGFECSLGGKVVWRQTVLL